MKRLVYSIVLAFALITHAQPAKAMLWQCAGYSENVEYCDRYGNCRPVRFQSCTWYDQIYWDFQRWWNTW